MKIRAEAKEGIEKQQRQSIKPKVSSSKRSTKLAKLQLRKNRQKFQTTEIRNESGDIVIQTSEIKIIMREDNE